MFKADAEKYLSVKEGVESAQDAAKLARSAGRGGDAAVTAATGGAWAVGLLLERGSLGDALDGFIDLCGEYGDLAKDAAESITNNLVPARDSVLAELGAAAGTAGKVSFDQSADLPSRFLEFDTAVGDFKSAVGLASLSTFGLPGAEAVTGPLAELSSALGAQENAITSTSLLFGKYRTAVGDFETSYSYNFATLLQAALDERTIKELSGKIQGIAGGIAMSGDEGVTGIKYAMANGGGFSKFLESFKVKDFLGRLADDVTSTFKADNWEKAWGKLWGIETGKFDDVLDAASRLTDEAAKVGDWSNWVKRLGGAADLLGYAGDVLEIADTGADAIEKFAEGDFLGAAGEVGYGAVKFLGGKGITALAGFAVGGPAGVVVGIGAGVLWDWGCEIVHDGKFQEHVDAFIGGAKDFAEDVGDFATGLFNGASDFFGGLVPSY